MRARVVWAIFAKELLETLRDRRTLFAMFVLPVLVYPLLFLAVGHATASSQARRKALRPVLGVWGEVPPVVIDALAKELGATVADRRATLPATPEADARVALTDGGLHLVIAAAPGATARLAGDDGVALDLYYDAVLPLSDAAHDRAVKVVEGLASSERDARLRRHHLPTLFDRPLTAVDKDVASKARRGGDIAGRTLPLILIVVMAICGLLPAVDLTAGEKERGTLQTLLCAPVTPFEIVAGKYLTVVCIALAGVAANLAAMGFAVSSQLAAIGEGALEFNLGIATYLAVFAAMIPAALLISAMLLALAVFARSFREANAYLTPVLLALMFPTLVAMMPGTELDARTALAPIVNLTLVARDLLRGRVDLGMYALVLLANFIYATLAILFAARVFEAEQVLLGGEKPWRDVFAIDGGRGARATPSPRNAVLFVAVLFVFLYYGALWVAGRGLGGIAAIGVVQVGLLLVPTLAWIAGYRFDWRATLSLRLPTARGAAGIVLLAAGAWAIGHALFVVEARLFPGAREYGELLDKFFADVHASLPTLVLVVAVCPAIAEELCFRGVVMSGLAGTGSRAIAVGGSALAFGLFHLNPYHVLVAAVLGGMLGYATLETGTILAGMAAHLVNNALGVVLPKSPTLEHALSSPVVLVAATACAIAGLALCRGSRRRPPPALSAPAS